MERQSVHADKASERAQKCEITLQTDIRSDMVIMYIFSTCSLSLICLFTRSASIPFIWHPMRAFINALLCRASERKEKRNKTGIVVNKVFFHFNTIVTPITCRHVPSGPCLFKISSDLLISHIQALHMYGSIKGKYWKYLAVRRTFPKILIQFPFFRCLLPQ